VILALLVTGQQVIQWWAKRKAREQALLALSDELDPTQAWAEAIATWQAGKAAANGFALMAPREQLNRLPLRWEGWILSTAVCRVSPAAVTNRTAQRAWACQAQYTRGTRDAVLSRDMARMLPQGWSVSFNPLSGMDVSWNFTQAATPLKIADLPKAEFFRVEVASRLQQLLPALAGEPSYSFTPVEIPAPKRKDGTSMPPPAEAQGIAAATLVVKAPMRNIDALIMADVMADWNEIRLVFDNQEPKGALKASTVMAEAKGEMYAKN
jgi:hypothetical protein